VAALGCGGGHKGNDGGGAGGGAGEGGTTGGGGQGGITESCFSQGMACANTGVRCCPPLVCAGSCVQPPNQDGGGSCPGSAGFGCLYGGCRGDVGTAPVCLDGTWGCPAGATDTRSCGGCTGNPPPDYVCGDGGWIHLDAGIGGAGGAGGAGGGSGAGGAGGVTGAGGVGGSGAGGAGGACGRFEQPCCPNLTCFQGACYGSLEHGICSA
jgi:hypothetical protein